MNLEHVFITLRRNGKISFRQLSMCGLVAEDVDELIESGLLKEIDNQVYAIDSVDELVGFGRYLLEREQYKDANAAFVCGYEKDPTNFNVNFQLFYRNLIKLRPEYLVKHFGVIYEYMKNNDRECDANYYLYLLGALIDLPEEYKKIFDNLKLDDMLIDSNDNYAINQNVLRKKIYENSYTRVHGIVDDRYAELTSNSITFEEKVEKELLLKWLVKNRAIYKRITELLVTDDIAELKNMLDNAMEHRLLSLNNEYLLKVVNNYIEIRNTGVVPEVKGKGLDAYEAIDNNNYELAIKLLTGQKEMNVSNVSHLCTMLKKIIELINTENKNVQPLIDAVHEMRSKYGTEKEVLTDKEKQSIKSKVEQLYNGRSAFLLEPMSQEKRDLVRSYLGSFKDVASFSIGIEPERRIVVRHHPIIKEYVDIGEVAQEAKRLYRREKYAEAAKNYELLLKLGRPRDITYGMYGLTLLRMNRRNESLDYLKIATIMSKEKEGTLDYSDLIYEIEHPHDSNLKPRVDVKVEEFTEENRNILNDELLNDLIGLTQEGEISLVDACKKLNLCEDDTNYVKLLYARDCYYKGDYDHGDVYLKQVEKCKNKSKKVKDLFKDIQLNRRYYVHRLDAEKKQLVFIKN